MLSALYYANSTDGGVTWSTNQALSPPFNHTLGYPVQRKMGDYIGMVSLNEAACIAYTATFNGEEDIYFVRVEQAIVTTIAKTGNEVTLSWRAVPGQTYCVQFKDTVNASWSAGSILGCVVAQGATASMQDRTFSGSSQRFYRVVAQP